MTPLILFFPPIAIISLALGAIFYVAALITLRFPPKNINSLYGYRTTSSMKNQQQWDFAQQYSGKKMKKLGGAYLVVGLFFYFLGYGPMNMLFILTVALLPPLFLIVATERAIKKRFPPKDT